MKRFPATILAAALLSACVSPSPEITFTAVRETEFTGRGNECETLLKVTAGPSGESVLRSVTVAVSNTADITALCLNVDGSMVAKVPVKPGRDSYRFRTDRPVREGTVLEICADIAADAEEGAEVTADISEIRTAGGKYTVEAPAEGAREILLARRLVFNPGDYGSSNYRIPAICTLKDGSLLIANDKRKFSHADLPADIDVVVRRSTDGGLTWSEPVTVAEGKGPDSGFGDPILAVADDGTVICAFSGGAGIWASTPEKPQKVWICRSTDNGSTWSEPRDVTAMQWGPAAKNPECITGHASFFGSGHGITLSKGPHAGRIMIVTAVHHSKESRFDNYAVYSDDNGLTWNISRRAFTGGDEAKVVELSDGRILMSVRHSGERGHNISEDGGETWGEQGFWKDVVTNACDGDIIRTSEGTLLQSLPNCVETRKNVSVFMSFDEGATWPAAKTICRGPSMYSSLTELPDGTIGAYVEEMHSDVECEMWFLNFSTGWLKK